MRRLSKVYLLFLIILVGLTNCKKDLDSYYARPSSLAQPIYQQLEAKGNFKNFLKLVDRANYKNILSTGGYWTCFAPNDAAFEKFFQDNNYSSVSDIDSLTASKIVRYMLVYSAYDSTKLDDYEVSTGSIVNDAFRRKTAYYKWVYTDTTNGTVRKVMDVTSNLYITYTENNNKYLTYFTDKYFAAKGLKTSDYNYFYPNSTFSQINVLDANVVGTGIFAENGFYYEINKVVLPQPNIYEYIKTKPDYSEFKKLMDRFASFLYYPDFQIRYLQATGKSDSVYHKYFNTLAFTPNGEEYMKNTPNDAQSNCWSILVPNNTALLDYERNTLAEYYNHDPSQIPLDIAAEFLNSHMYQTALWPSQFKSTTNSLGEPATVDVNSNVTDAKILSNGLFYGTNKVHVSNSFTTVYAEPFLNPAYDFMIRLMGTTYKSILTNKRNRYTLFLVTDQEYASRGFTYNTIFSAWNWYGAASVTNQWVANATAKMTKDLNLQIVQTPNDELNDLSGEGIVKTFGGDCIKFKNNQVFGGGNADSASVANVTGYRDYDNGRVYFLDHALEYSEMSPAGRLRILAGYNPNAVGTNKYPVPTKYYLYYKYLIKSGLITASSITSGSDSSRMLITGVSSGDFYTFMVPVSDSITAAVAKGKLPNFTSTSATDLTTIKGFVLYHIINKILIPDGDEDDNGNANTAYKNIDGDIQLVR
ncbi:MAG TPA: fasciclin domain-containing protein, partial [Bacteroidales bacterium]